MGNGQFSWVAIQHGPGATCGSLNIFDLISGQNESFDLPGRPGFAKPTQHQGVLVVGCERQLGIYHTRERSWEVLCDGIDADVTGTIINDGTCFGDNLIFGCKDLEFKTTKAGLYLYRGSDRKLIQLRDDQICSNGKAIRETASGLELIDIDSPTRQVAAYDLDIAAGRLGERRVLLDLTGDPAVPDGAILTPDGDGLIVSMFHPTGVGEGETRLYDLTDGRLRTVWKTHGSPQNTCPNLIGCDGKVVLVITTAVENMTPERSAGCPDAGCLFIGDTDFDKPTPMPTWPA